MTTNIGFVTADTAPPPGREVPDPPQLALRAATSGFTPARSDVGRYATGGVR
jgi:hypothetical protein